MNKIKRDPKRGNLIASYRPRFNFTPFEKRPLNNLQNFERKVSNFPIYLRLQNVIIKRRNDTIFRNRTFNYRRKISPQKDLVESIVNVREHSRIVYVYILCEKHCLIDESILSLSLFPSRPCNASRCSNRLRDTQYTLSTWKLGFEYLRRKKRESVSWSTATSASDEGRAFRFGISIPLIPAYPSFRYTALIRADILWRVMDSLILTHDAHYRCSPLHDQPSLTRSQ